MTGTLTRTEQVLEVLRAGGRAEPGRGNNQGVWKLFDVEGNEVRAWNHAIKTAAAIKDNRK